MSTRAACLSGVRYSAAQWPGDMGGSGAELKVEECK